MCLSTCIFTKASLLIEAEASAARDVTSDLKEMSLKREAREELSPELAGSDEQPKMSNQGELLSSKVPLISISLSPRNLRTTLLHKYPSVSSADSLVYKK